MTYLYMIVAGDVNSDNNMYAKLSISTGISPILNGELFTVLTIKCKDMEDAINMKSLIESHINNISSNYISVKNNDEYVIDRECTDIVLDTFRTTFSLINKLRK